MATNTVPNDLILFHYPFSPYARRVIWYLTLRKIEYGQCIQPPVMPRPDLEALGVKYRRIPLMSHGRSIYCDTRLILKKLEESFPASEKHPALGPADPTSKTLVKLLEHWTIDAGIFNRAASLIPPDLKLMKDEKFQQDRQDYTGRSWKPDAMAKGRPESLAYIKEGFALLEEGLLSDGREWVLGGNKPSLADIEAVWPFHWLIGMKGALRPDVISKESFPKVYAWVDRFDNAIKTAKSTVPKPVSLKGKEALTHITSATFPAVPFEKARAEPLDVNVGDDIEVWPIDSGFKHHDKGKLILLTDSEIGISMKAENGKEIRLHMPRWGFRAVKADGAGSAKL